MNNELATTAPAEIQHVPGEDMELCALSPGDMPKCQENLIAWCARKIGAMSRERDEFLAEWKHATAQKWKTAFYKRHLTIASKRVVFYQKIKAALEAGYYIVPNFPVTLFAIRTAKEKPATLWTNTVWMSKFIQKAQVLPQGEGVYQSPNPIVRAGSEYEVTQQDGRKARRQDGWADEWDEMEFPVNMAKLEIMEATTRAMGIKVFDEIGMLPSDKRRHPDPIIVGRITDPRAHGWGEKRQVSFLLAWHLDTKTL